MNKPIMMTIFAALATLGMQANAQEEASTATASRMLRAESKLAIRGVPVTGWNKVFGEPARDLRFVGNLNFDVAGVFNPNGQALPIDAGTSPDALLASYAAPDVYLAFFGVPDAQNTPNQNILYADYPQLSTHDSQFGPLPQLADNPDWFGKSNGAENEGLTVRKWLSLSGSMRFECKPNARPSYSVRVRDAIPGGLYTIWGFYFDQDVGQLMPDFAFGGTSANVFVADKDGRIDGSRALNFCPQRVTAQDRYVPVATFLVYHPDGRVNAAVGHTVATPPFIGPGMTASPQIMFAMPKDDF